VITVLVAAATSGGRAGLEALLADRTRFTVVSGPLVQGVKDTHPDVVLMELPPRPLAAALRELSRLPHGPAVVVLARDPRRALTPEALRAGVRAALPPEATATEIAAAIEAAAAGLVALPADGLAPVAAPAASAAGHEADVSPQPLTARETEILGMIAEGLGNKLIAARLGISDHTVKFHIASIFTKLGAGSRTEAVTIGVRRGLILI
jgi:DNA-binding NarL/FixJ family response regulator